MASLLRYLCEAWRNWYLIGALAKCLPGTDSRDSDAAAQDANCHASVQADSLPQIDAIASAVLLDFIYNLSRIVTALATDDRIVDRDSRSGSIDSSNLDDDVFLQTNRRLDVVAPSPEQRHGERHFSMDALITNLVDLKCSGPPKSHKSPGLRLCDRRGLFLEPYFDNLRGKLDLQRQILHLKDRLCHAETDLYYCRKQCEELQLKSQQDKVVIDNLEQLNSNFQQHNTKLGTRVRELEEQLVKIEAPRIAHQEPPIETDAAVFVNGVHFSTRMGGHYLPGKPSSADAEPDVEEDSIDVKESFYFGDWWIT